ncbi:MAG: hypothetical protein H0X37_25385 [Herpetosiphonaceae bacterium]|nr:hypothetical protein [Herpetosiphonaceae bacterium]
MDLATLVPAIVGLLSPLLPYLVKASDGAASEAGKKIGGAAWDHAKTIWQKLRPAVVANHTTAEAVQDVIDNPQDSDAQAALRKELRKLLQTQPELVKELQAAVTDAQRAGVIVNVSGERNIGVGGNANGSTFITGDGNSVGDDKRQGAFVSGGTVHGAVVGTNTGTITGNYGTPAGQAQDDPLTPIIAQLRSVTAQMQQRGKGDDAEDVEEVARILDQAVRAQVDGKSERRAAKLNDARTKLQAVAQQNSGLQKLQQLLSDV